MTVDPNEDDALSWAGDEREKPTPVLVDAEDDDEAAAPTSSVLLICYGVLGGVFLLYTFGWVIAVQRRSVAHVPPANALNQIMSQLGEGLAIASPILWIAAAFLLTRGRRPIVRLLWMLLGLLVVVPWPFVVGAWLR